MTSEDELKYPELEQEVLDRQARARRIRQAAARAVDPLEMERARKEAKAFRDKTGLTQAQMAEHCGMSVRRYTNFENDSGITTPSTLRMVRKAIAAGRGVVASPLLAQLNGPDGPKEKLSLYPLYRENLFFLGDQLSRHKQTPISFDVSNSINWLEEDGTKEDVAEFEQLIFELTKKKDEHSPPNGSSFLSVVEDAEQRQRASKHFADSVPSGLLGRLYAGFITARLYDAKSNPIEATILFVILGASTGEDWNVQFSSTLDPTDHEFAREFNEQNLAVKK